jgi:oligopeptide/dipeptide ABC transporter ATP-binding protein
MEPLVAITGFRLAFDGFEGRAEVLDGIDLSIASGERVGIVGETGCGKSVLARSITDLVPRPPAVILSGDIRFAGESVPGMAAEARARLRGRDVAMIFQDPMTYLNPLFSIGSQMIDVIRAQDRAADRPVRSRRAASAHAATLLDQVRLPDAQALLGRYPHELSGGMRQRVLIAMALTGRPRLLIADEPTTALDVTIQLQILGLIRDIVSAEHLALMLISHDLGVIAAAVDRVVVMYAGTIVEDAPTAALLTAPRHPYTAGLIAAVPDVSRPEFRVRGIPGHIPSLLSPPNGCRFHPRCERASDLCRSEKPALRRQGDHGVACHHPMGPA